MANKKILNGLNHKDFEHPSDRKALSALENTPGLDVVAKFVVKHAIEKVCTVQYTGSNIRITEKGYPDIYQLLSDACNILDVHDKPELYLQWGYSIDGFSVGAENPLIVLKSGVIDICNRSEALFLIGRELGHIKSMHMLYHMIAQTLSYVIDSIPGGSLLGASLQMSLNYWSRMSEFTADRAGLLCCQNKDAAITAMMKSAGIPVRFFDKISYESFVEQARSFRQLDYAIMNKVIKLLSIVGDSHPWTVMRAAELLKWVESGEYDRILNK